jgi:hypothetical protein
MILTTLNSYPFFPVINAITAPGTDFFPDGNGRKKAAPQGIKAHFSNQIPKSPQKGNKDHPNSPTAPTKQKESKKQPRPP